MNIRVKTYSTVTALGADAVVSGGYLYLTGFEPILVRGIEPTAVIAPTTEVLQISTGTPTATNGATYQISITYTSKQSNTEEIWYSTPYVADATATVTEICDNLRAQIVLESNSMPITGSGSTTLILTAQTGYPIFTVTNISTSGVIAFVTGTPGVAAVGRGDYIKNGNFAEVAAMVGIVDASYYYQVIMNYNNKLNVGSSQRQTDLVNKAVLFVLSTATNVEKLVGTYGTLTQALVGVDATWSETPAGSTPTLAYTTATGALALAGAGNTWTANSLVVGDILYYPAAPTVYYPITVQTSNTAGFSTAGIGSDVAAAAYAFVQLRRA